MSDAPERIRIEGGRPSFRRYWYESGEQEPDEGDAEYIRADLCVPQQDAEPLNELATRVREINRANGWQVPTRGDWSDPYRIAAFLALIHSEVSEALEGFRAADRENVAEELADVLIRTLDLAVGLGIDMDQQVQAKLAKNRQRGHKHGGKRI